METELVKAALEALRGAEDDEAMFRRLEVSRDALLREPGAGQVLAGMIGSTGERSEPDATALVLLEAVLDAARMAAENDQPKGPRFLDALEAHLGALAGAQALTTTGRVALGRAFVRAGLPPSPHLVIGEAGDSGFDPGLHPADMPDIDALLDDLRKTAGSDSMVLHTAMSEMMAAMPPEVRTMIVTRIARRGEEVFPRVACYWLLDRDAGLRQAAAEGFLARVEAGEMDATTAARLILLRAWLPGDGARRVLDRVIREAVRREVSGGAGPRRWTVHRVLASIPDGAGAQSIAVVVQSGGSRAIAMLLLKQGYGVKDAYVLPCESASEQKRILATIAGEMGAEDVTPGFVREALATALGEGLEAGCLPAAGLIDVADVCGLDDLRPEPRSVGDLIAAIDPEGVVAGMSPQRLGALVNRSADWTDRYEMLNSWFEDSAAVLDVLTNSITPRARLRDIRAVLEDRRPWWTRLIARTAVTLHAAGEPDWLEFAATAHALEKGRDLKKTPIMEEIAAWTLERPGDPWDRVAGALEPEAAEIDLVDAPAMVAPEKTGELARLLKASDFSSDWLDGYLMAVVVAPKMIAPGSWIAPITEAVVGLPGHTALQRFLDIVMLRYNSANEDAADPIRLKNRFGRRSAKAIAAWADGFTTVTERFPSAWPKRALNKKDKAVLGLMTAASRHGDDTDRLAALLPTWLSRRFGLRS